MENSDYEMGQGDGMKTNTDIPFQDLGREAKSNSAGQIQDRGQISGFCFNGVFQKLLRKTYLR